MEELKSLVQKPGSKDQYHGTLKQPAGVFISARSPNSTTGLFAVAL